MKSGSRRITLLAVLAVLVLGAAGAVFTSARWYHNWVSERARMDAERRQSPPAAASESPEGEEDAEGEEDLSGPVGLPGPGLPPFDQRAQAPGFALRDLEGREVRLSDLQGDPVVLQFIAAGCDPCRAEIPHLNALAQDYGSQGLRVLALAIEDSPDAVRAYTEPLRVGYPILVAGAATARLYQASPSVLFFIDRWGRIVRSQSGYPDPALLRELAVKLLGEGTP